MQAKIPNLKAILKPIWAHAPGIGMIGGEFRKQEVAEQATFPHDKKLLDKIGLKRGQKILAIAGYYGNWASEIAKAGAKVDYSDVAKSLVDYARNKYKKLFGKYIHSDYALIPKTAKEYDWTFTFEACGGKQGLPIAYLHSLLNKNGGKLVIYYNLKHTSGKHKRYPSILKKLSAIYGSKSKIDKIKVNASRKQQFSGMLPHRVYTLLTNNSARNKAQTDLQVLDYLQNKRVLEIMKDSRKLNMTKKDFLNSLKRLNRFTKLLDKEFIKEIKI